MIIGGIATPTVPAIARVGIAFTVTAPVGGGIPAGRLTARCYRLSGTRDYVLVKSVPASVLLIGGQQRIYARPTLGAGRHVVVIESEESNLSRFSGPSGGVTVR
jgi:hypothetical protein